MPDDVTYFARTNYRNQFRKFGIKLDDRRRHMYLIGKTGMGKSTTLENMIVQDIQSGQGLAVIDPHGDLIEKVLDYVPTSRINDVVYFNPSDITYPMAFNVLETVIPEQRYLVASGLMSVFKKIWADSWGPRLEYVLRNTILSLLEYPGTTLLGINRLLVDKLFRRKVVSKITDPIIKAFWIDEYAAYSANFRTEAISPIQNKVGQFLSSSVIRNIVGQPKSTIDLRDVMDNHKILLMNLAKGRIGEDNSALLGAMMITKIQLAAMSRVNVPESERSDFFLYVDEFQNFATESFAAILSEARKYRLDLVIAHQYIEQLEEEVRAAVFGNVGTIVCFRVGAADAEFLEREFAPVFDENDLVNLTKYDVYLKLMIDGVASTAFSATTIEPLTESGKTGTREKVIQVSRERYAKPRDVVEEKISRWSGFHEEEPSAPVSERPPTRPSGNGEPVRERPRERPADAPLSEYEIKQALKQNVHALDEQIQHVVEPPPAEELSLTDALQKTVAFSPPQRRKNNRKQRPPASQQTLTSPHPPAPPAVPLQPERAREPQPSQPAPKPVPPSSGQDTPPWKPGQVIRFP